MPDDRWSNLHASICDNVPTSFWNRGLKTVFECLYPLSKIFITKLSKTGGTEDLYGGQGIWEHCATCHFKPKDARRQPVTDNDSVVFNLYFLTQSYFSPHFTSHSNHSEPKSYKVFWTWYFKYALHAKWLTASMLQRVSKWS